MKKKQTMKEKIEELERRIAILEYQKTIIIQPQYAPSYPSNTPPTFPQFPQPPYWVNNSSTPSTN